MNELSERLTALELRFESFEEKTTRIESKLDDLIRLLSKK
jgi:chaperonin cofactor prefoldin